MTALDRLIKPRSVAVVGASADVRKTSGRPVAFLRKHGFQGAIYPVNPNADAIADLPCYPDVESLPAAPDVAIVLLGAARAHLAVEALAKLGTPAAIVLASGYAETGDEGALRQQQLLRAAGNMRLLGPNTIGLVNLTDKIILSASGALDMDEFCTGSIGVVSQSGGILGALLSRASARGIGLSKLVSTSNEADIDLSDVLDYLVEDDATKVIALYIESIRNPATFRAAAVKAARCGKPIVAFKIGRSEAGAKAAVSHTGAMAGSDRMYDALFQHLGIIRANTFSDLLDIPAALATGRKLEGRRIAILTSTGGAGTLVSDSLGVSGFETPPPDTNTVARLRALQPGSDANLDCNPIDVTLAGLQPALLRGAIEALLESPSYDALTIIAGSSAIGQPQLMADAIGACLLKSRKPVLAYVSPHAPGVAAVLTRKGVPAFSAPESCTAAYRSMWTVAQARTPHAQMAAKPDIDISDFPAGPLDESQAKQLFARFGIPHVRETIVAAPGEAKRAVQDLGGQAVLKVLSKDLTHKSEVGGVMVGVSVDRVDEVFDSMVRTVAAKGGFTPKRFLVQEMVRGAFELILGLRHDHLGRAILLGMGGVTAELFNDTAIRMLPEAGGLSHEDALGMARELKCWPLLNGFRGRPLLDIDALVAAIVAFSNMAAQLGDRLGEAEINPLFVLHKGKGTLAADGVAHLNS